MEEKKIERENWIDVSRGVAIIFVMMGHLPLHPTINAVIYSFHMPLFFIISGFFAFDSLEIPFNTYLRKKSSRLITPYLFFGLLLMIPFGIFFSVIKDNSFDLSIVLTRYINSLIGHLIGLRSDWPYCGTYWFLACLFTSLILIFLITKYLKNYTIDIIILFSGIGFIYNFYIGRSLPFSFDLAMIAILFLWLGSFFYKNRPYFTWKLSLVCGIIGLIASFFNGKVEMYDGSFNNPILFLLSGVGISVLILKICSSFKKLSILSWLGINSLLIYLLHYLFRPFISHVLVKLPGSELLIINTLYSFIGVCIICILLWPIIKIINHYFPFLLGISK